MKKITILTGAGISAESGISTFRDANGLWENHPIEDVATPQGFRKNPQLVLDFYNQRRAQLFHVEPNAGHKALADLETKYDVHIITQNVDDLHERAGSTKVLHLHGELRKIRSVKTGEVKRHDRDINIGDVCAQGGQWRPHIVWFNEQVPLMSDAEDIVAACDELWVVGTSLVVYPAAGLLFNTRAGVPIYYIDPFPAAVRSNVHVIAEPATVGVPRLVSERLHR